MKIKDKIKLGISRNWKFPGQIRLLKYLKPSSHTSTSFKDGIIWLDNEDLAIFTTSDSYIENAILTTGTYEAEIQKIISFSLQPGDFALDIGCNIGLQSLRMHKIVGASGKIISFEPLDYLRKKSIKNFNLNKSATIHLLPYALSDIEGTLELSINENVYNQGTFSLLQNSSGATRQIIEIKVGDDLPEIKSLEKLNLIKIDVEGFEFNVLKGLKFTLSRLKPRIIFEYDSNYWIRNKQDIVDCYRFLTALNYTFYQITFIGCELIRAPEQITDGNLFCIAEE
jgi:FkbM family methyltransferase